MATANKKRLPKVLPPDHGSQSRSTQKARRQAEVHRSRTGRSVASEQQDEVETEKRQQTQVVPTAPQTAARLHTAAPDPAPDAVDEVTEPDSRGRTERAPSSPAADRDRAFLLWLAVGSVVFVGLLIVGVLAAVSATS